ncbi:MAG: hypothetical protein ACJAW3_000728 [Lentimonas sp.]|jgi:hypothetical protein
MTADRTKSPSTSIYLNSKTSSLSGNYTAIPLQSAPLSIGEPSNTASITISEFATFDDELTESAIEEG